MQFRVRRNVRLDEDDRLLWVETGRQPVERDIDGIFLYARSVGVIGGERVPVRNLEKAFILVLHADPVLQCADVVAEMQFAGRAHAAQHAFASWDRGRHRADRPDESIRGFKSAAPTTGIWGS